MFDYPRPINFSFRELEYVKGSKPFPYWLSLHEGDVITLINYSNFIFKKSVGVSISEYEKTNQNKFFWNRFDELYTSK